MTPAYLLAFIRANANMPDEATERIAAAFAPVRFEKGDHLLRAGEVNDRYVVVGEGWLRLFTYDTTGDEVTTGFAGPGHVCFDVDSFFMRTPSRENVVAISDVQGSEISFAGLNHLFHADPEFREMGRMVLVKGFVGLKQRMLAMINTRAEERYAALMRAQPELFQHAQLKHIASYLGVTDSSLSRIRKEFVRRD